MRPQDLIGLGRRALGEMRRAKLEKEGVTVRRQLARRFEQGDHLRCLQVCASPRFAKIWITSLAATDLVAYQSALRGRQLREYLAPGTPPTPLVPTPGLPAAGPSPLGIGRPLTEDTDNDANCAARTKAVLLAAGLP